MKNAIRIAIATSAIYTVGKIIAGVNRLQRGSHQYILDRRMPTPAEVDKMTPRQLARLEREQEDFLDRVRRFQTC